MVTHPLTLNEQKLNKFERANFNRQLIAELGLDPVDFCVGKSYGQLCVPMLQVEEFCAN